MQFFKLGLVLCALQLTPTATQAATFVERREQMRTVCLNQDWSKVTCNIAPSMDHGLGYKMNVFDKAVDWVADNGMFQGVSSAKWVLEKYIAPNSSTAAAVREQDQLLSEIETELKNFSDQNSLSSCAKACLATCASSQLISFDIDTVLALEYRASYILSKGVGLCRHFSELADHLLGALGISSQSVSGTLYQDGYSGGHAWVSVKLGGKKYWMEPQSQDCTFYDPKVSQ